MIPRLQIRIKMAGTNPATLIPANSLRRGCHHVQLSLLAGAMLLIWCREEHETSELELTCASLHMRHRHID